MQREHALWVSPAYFFISGEPQLEKAISFARQHLESMRAGLESPLAEQVERALYLPLTRTYKRQEAVHYMSEYGEEEGHNPSLLELAKLDFNLLQHVHLKELNAISKWWKDLYGSVKWDESAVFLLPEYLKSFYSELLSNIAEFQGELAVDNYKIAYAKKAEAEWSHQNHKPSFEDQVTLFTVSSAMPMLPVIIMKEGAVEWVRMATVIIASAKIGRFTNDIAAFQHGKNRGDVASSVECYIKEHGVTGEVAIARINSLIEDERKATNQARFKRPRMPQAVKRVINFTLSWPVFYDDMKDGYTFGEHLRETIGSLFVKPVPI
ncbi:hypothetical protein BRADI_1g49245v3 [Brachypodium distachyon]|uniref:Terpene synthase metal-binding domain-containing protein n=1 Tax=Brachypodium distachyon TaxID=15368 RepID=A0A2K2DQH3_BRADI|nr:hypothetical protein BRADI_1g49245v3 [Brachypodium distachyon]